MGSVAHFQVATLAQTTLDLLGLVVLERANHLVVRVDEGGHHDLAFRGVGEATGATGTAATEHAAKQVEVGVARAAFSGRQLNARSVVGQDQHGRGIIEFDGAGDRAHQATAKGAQEAAQATSLVVTTDAIVGALRATSDATSDVTSSLRDDKIVRAARDDAASFVATNGAIRGVKLESAFDTIRRVAPQLQASDAQLAQAILAI